MDLNFVIDIIASIFAVFAIEKFMRVFFEKRKTSFFSFVSSCFLYIIVMAGISLVINIPIVNLFCNIALLFLITLNYNSSVLRKLSAVFIVYAFMFISDVLVVSISGYFDYSPLEHIKYEPLLGTVIIPLMLYLEATLAQNFKNVKRNNPVSGVYWISSVAIPIISMFLMILIGIATNLSRLIEVFAVIAIFLINVLAFYLHDSLSMAYADKLKNKLTEQEKEYYYNQCELMRESTEDLKAFKHDIQNHLSATNNYIKNGNPDEASDYLVKLIGEVAFNSIYSDSGNTAFDSIINYKLRNAKEKGITLEVDIAVPAKVGIEVIDVVTIIGNLLDNAINAVEKASDKRIVLKIDFNKGRLIINTENTFNGEVDYEDGEVVSKKGKGHGYGLKNIRKSADKYNGYLEIDYNDKWFFVDVLLYVKTE